MHDATYQVLAVLSASAAISTVLLLPVLGAQLLRGRIRAAARSITAIVLLTLLGMTAALTLADATIPTITPT